MNVKIHYFSGCGSCHWIALLAQKFLTQKGHHVVGLQNMDLPKIDIQEKVDADIFIAPVYFFGLPANVVHYLRYLPIVANRPALFWSVNGGLSGTARRMASWWLKERGYEILTTHTIEMPDSFLGLPQASDEEKQALVKEASLKVERLVDDLNQVPTFKAESWIFFIIGALAYFPYYYYFRSIFGLAFVATKDCTHCAKCVENCPVSCIRFENQKPQWRHGCIGCFRCVNGCPSAAIDMSGMAFILGILLACMGWFSFGFVFSFAGFLTIIFKWIGALGGFYLGAFLFQRFSSFLSFRPLLFFKGKKRRFFDEKDL